MPRTAGVSCTSTVWPMRRRPSPAAHALCVRSRPFRLFVNVTLIFLSALIALTFSIARCRARASGLHLLHRQTALLRDLLRRTHVLQCFERRAYHVDRIRRAVALREHVVYACRFEQRTHRAA